MRKALLAFHDFGAVFAYELFEDQLFHRGGLGRNADLEEVLLEQLGRWEIIGEKPVAFRAVGDEVPAARAAGALFDGEQVGDAGEDDGFGQGAEEADAHLVSPVIRPWSLVKGGAS